MKNVRKKNDLFNFYFFFFFFAKFRFGTLDVPYALFRFLLHDCALNMEVAIFNFIFLVVASTLIALLINCPFFVYFRTRFC